MKTIFSQAIRVVVTNLFIYVLLFLTYLITTSFQINEDPPKIIHNGTEDGKIDPTEDAIVPLAVGNYWYYTGTFWGMPGTGRLDITGTSTINSDLCYKWKKQGDTTIWYMNNHGDGLWCYGYTHLDSTFIQPELFIKYPAQPGDHWQSKFAEPGQEVTITCLSIDTTFAQYSNCYSYYYGIDFEASKQEIINTLSFNLLNKSLSKFSTIRSGFYDVYLFYKPSIGMVGGIWKLLGQVIMDETLHTYSIGNALSPPTLLSPQNGSTIQVLNPTLDWSDVVAAISYRVQVATDQYFNSLVVDQSNLTTSSYNVSSMLTNNVTYYWRVNATDGTISSPWSDVWILTVGAAQNEFLILDATNNPIQNKEFKFYEVSRTGGGKFIEVFKGSATTDDNGKVYFNPAWFFPGDTVKVHRVVWDGSTTRPKHKIKIDNGKFDNSGNLSYDTLTSNQPQSMILDHTTVMYDLTVSIEWDATGAYLDSLERGFRYLSNYLYDVLNGQLFINSITIYDNKQHWNDVNTDIWIFAQNDYAAHTDWLIDHKIKLPRITYSDIKEYNIKLTNAVYPYSWTIKGYNSYGISGYIYPPIRSLAHEFGHHAIGFGDEYKDDGIFKVFPNVDDPLSILYYGLQPNYDFGLMDWPSLDDIPQNSEMSSATQYEDASHQVTSQWTRNGGKSCWDIFKDKFERKYDDISVLIKTPPLHQTIEWPNNDIENPQYNVGALMDIQKNNFGSSQSDFILTVIDHGTKKRLSNVFVRLEKNNGTSQYMIEQGYTCDNLNSGDNNKGNLRLLGLNIGDRIWCTKFLYITSGTEISTLSNILVELSPTFGFLDFVPSLQIGSSAVHKYTHSSANNSYVLSLYCSRELITPPTLEIFPGNTNVFYSFMYDQTSNKYVVELPDSILNTGLFSITALDDSSVQHQSFLKYSVLSPLNLINSNDGNALINIDTINNTITRFCILSSDFPSNFIGVEEKAVRAGDVYSITSFPNVSTLAGENTITISYSNTEIDKQKEASIRIYRFDESQRKWIKIGGVVNTARKVTAEITSLGIYAAFTTSAISTNPKLDNNNVFFYPNPVNPDAQTGKFVFGIDKSGDVKIKVYDISNTLVKTIDAGNFNQGSSYEVSWDGRNGNGQIVANGVYYYVVESSSGERGTGKIAVLR